MALLLIFSVVAAAAIGRFSQCRRPVRPILTGAAMILVGGCLLAQLIRPALLPTFERDAAAIWSGQVYRLFTALWFQDGGWKGGLFNLAVLAFVGAAAERLWDRRICSIVYLVGGVASEIVALWWQPIGAGNSIAWMSLAGAVLVKGLPAREPPAVRLAGLAGLAAGLLLAVQTDIHGIALLIGAGLGSAFLRFSERDRLRRPDAEPAGV
ncbi:MAG TPA: rhomboid family intramembrane serine protease [Allosphingosinicella sp.]|jgi:rhomboid protease GluP|nr:rhomboid family intramembrane serine protease [Allosphingosinicella sp.]